MQRLARVVALFAILLACETPAAKPADLLRVPVTIETETGPVTFQAEVADTPASRAQGLMYRTELGEREGMLFVFPAEGELSFWMKNTLIPLDMIFIRADRTVLGIVHRAEPRTTTPRRVPGRSQYVLEVAGGKAEALDVRAGQQVRFMLPPAER